MKIDIENGTTTTGLIFKKTFYKFELKIELTEQEKAIIKERNLKNQVILELPMPRSMADVGGNWDLTFGDLLNGRFYYDANTPSQIKDVQELVIKKLKVAKEYLIDNETVAENRSIEI